MKTFVIQWNELETILNIVSLKTECEETGNIFSNN